MITHCPSCGAGNDVPAASPDDGGAAVSCSLCGNEWIEAYPAGIRPGQVVEIGAGPDIQPLMLAARQAREAFSVQRRQRQWRAGAWAVLLIIALSPVLGALAFPERVVAAAPATIDIYDWLGRDVNIYGLDIRRLTVEHLTVGGRPEMTVSGELTNISNTDRKSPWLRFGIRDEAYAEIYSWQLDIGAQPLKPGDTRRFATKLASPPEAARKVEIRFARADEIGSNERP